MSFWGLQLAYYFEQLINRPKFEYFPESITSSSTVLSFIRYPNVYKESTPVTVFLEIYESNFIYPT
jgi:hypothetical protein